MLELALIIIVSTIAGGLIMACWTVAHEAWQRQMDNEFYAGYMHGLNKIDTPGDPASEYQTAHRVMDAALDGKEVMRIGVHHP